MVQEKAYVWYKEVGHDPSPPPIPLPSAILVTLTHFIPSEVSCLATSCCNLLSGFRSRPASLSSSHASGKLRCRLRSAGKAPATRPRPLRAATPHDVAPRQADPSSRTSFRSSSLERLFASCPSVVEPPLQDKAYSGANCWHREDKTLQAMPRPGVSTGDDFRAFRDYFCCFTALSVRGL